MTETTKTEYKNTLNLPQTTLAMRANATVRELEIQKFWQENDIYNKMWEQRAAESEAYEYANEKYQIIAAKNNDELVTESNNQHNCVDSYEGSVLSGRCKIFFMRSTDPEKVDKSILTIELLANDVIGQVKASCNRAPKMSQLKFVEEWAKEKNLSFDRDEVMAMEW